MVKRMALNGGLAAAVLLVAWKGRAELKNAQAERRANLNVPITHVTPAAVAPTPRPQPVQAADYSEVAGKNLFSKDRNPSVIEEAPPAKAAKVMPPLPVVYGIAILPSGTKALMAENTGAVRKIIGVGDRVGEFQVLSIDSRKVTFDWDGQELERNIDDIEGRASHAEVGAPAAVRSTSAAGGMFPAVNDTPPTASITPPAVRDIPPAIRITPATRVGRATSAVFAVPGEMIGMAR